MKTLHRQFIVAILIILTVSTAIGYVIATMIYQYSIKDKIDQQNIEKALAVVAQLQQDEADPASINHYLTFVGELGYQLFLRGPSGEGTYYGMPFAQTVLPQKAIDAIDAGTIYVATPTLGSMFVMMDHFSNDVANTVGVPFVYEGKQYGLFLRPNNKLLFTDFHMILVWIIVAITIVSMVSVFFLSRRLTRPITKLTQATKEITRENFNFELNIDRHDEIGQLAKSFQVMQRQLQHNDEARKAFISNVSHDFQSPLMNIRGYAELLKSKACTEHELNEYVAIIERESKRMSNVTKQLLLLTSLDQKNYPMKLSKVQLDELIKDLIRRLQWRLEENEIELSYNVKPISLKADPELLLNVLENILTNAIKYNKSGGSIWIRLEQVDHEAKLVIKDTGIGMDEAELEQIFDRFYRVDKARDKDGSGLGLSIVKQIISLHQGRIKVESEVQVGSSFTIWLPLSIEVTKQ